MATKRPGSPELVPNPFIKKRNLEWAISTPERGRAALELEWTASPLEAIDAPTVETPESNSRSGSGDAAAVEAGALKIDDHAASFSALLTSKALVPFPDATPRLSVEAYRALYERCAGSRDGAHFVVHQHDHPVAGTHYDLRLQINESSSVSWAIMYGLPGDPNSVRLMRNATETRVHCLWNHLIETASADTGSLLIWDTGTYTVLERRSKHAPAIDPSSQASAASGAGEPAAETEQEKLQRAFANRKIKLRLNGTRLPTGYVVYLRLTKMEDAEGRNKATRTPTTPRRRRAGRRTLSPVVETSESSDGEQPDPDEDAEAATGAEHAAVLPTDKDSAHLSAMERELRELEDADVRRTNAYPGAHNSVGSIHQRKWYLSFDRAASGLVERRVKGRTVWGCPPLRLHASPRRQHLDDTPGGSGLQGDGGRDEVIEDEDDRLRFPFYVRGPSHERSVVTGRLGEDILGDEGVAGFVQRKGWQPVLN